MVGFVNNTAQYIKVGSIGAIGDYNRHSHGCYIFEFSSSPYILQNNKTNDGKFVESGELVMNGRNFIPSISYLIWYFTPGEEIIKTNISLRNVIKSDMSVTKINFIKELPTCLKTIK